MRRGSFDGLVRLDSRPLPVGAVRDALGLVRLLWIGERDGVDLGRVSELTWIGETLRAALDHAGAKPGSRNAVLALARSAEAVERLAALEWSAEVAELVRAAGDRVRRGELRPDDARDVKRNARR